MAPGFHSSQAPGNRRVSQTKSGRLRPLLRRSERTLLDIIHLSAGYIIFSCIAGDQANIKMQFWRDDSSSSAIVSTHCTHTAQEDEFVCIYCKLFTPVNVQLTCVNTPDKSNCPMV